MRKLMSTMLAGMMLAGLTFAMVGCTDESGVTTKTEVTGPGGKTTVTDTTKVDKTGKNPPAVPVDKP